MCGSDSRGLASPAVSLLSRGGVSDPHRVPLVLALDKENDDDA